VRHTGHVACRVKTPPSSSGESLRRRDLSKTLQFVKDRMRSCPLVSAFKDVSSSFTLATSAALENMNCRCLSGRTTDPCFLDTSGAVSSPWKRSTPRSRSPGNKPRVVSSEGDWPRPSQHRRAPDKCLLGCCILWRPALEGLATCRTWRCFRSSEAPRTTTISRCKSSSINYLRLASLCKSTRQCRAILGIVTTSFVNCYDALIYMLIHGRRSKIFVF